MPYRDRATVESWVQEFNGAQRHLDTHVSVLEQIDATHPDTGLVVVSLRNASTVTYIQPVVRETPQWLVTFEARDHDLELDAAGMAQLAADVSLVAALCDFLQAKTDAAVLAAAEARTAEAPPAVAQLADPQSADAQPVDIERVAL